MSFNKKKLVVTQSDTDNTDATHEEQCPSALQRNGLEIRGKCFVRRVMKREFPLRELLHCRENVLQRNKTSGIQGGDSFLDCMFTTSTILVHYPSFGGTSHKNMMILTICINKGHQSYCTTICY